jgi:septal ring factor EnvC (AmiA/AmiB activator)
MKFTDLLPPRKELVKKADQLAGEIERGKKEIEKLSIKKGDSEKLIAGMSRTKAEFEQQRRKAIMDEESQGIIDSIEESIKQEESREKQHHDRIEGLIDAISQWGQKVKKEEVEQTSAADQVQLFDLYDLYDRYNEAAPKLAEIVRGIYNIRKTLGMGTNGGWPDVSVTGEIREKSVFEDIPKLRSREEIKNEGPNADCRLGFFWHRSTWQMGL